MLEVLYDARHVGAFVGEAEMAERKVLDAIASSWLFSQTVWYDHISIVRIHFH